MIRYLPVFSLVALKVSLPPCRTYMIEALSMVARLPGVLLLSLICSLQMIGICSSRLARARDFTSKTAFIFMSVCGVKNKFGQILNYFQSKRS